MESAWNEAVDREIGAALDMLENAIRACPESIWGDRDRRPEFWYLVYHTLFFLDYYSADSPEGFAPPAPFTLDELDPAGILPDRVYTKDEMLTYLAYGRARCRAMIAATTGERVAGPSGFARPGLSAGELLLQTLRHVQHHVAQLHLILRQTVDGAPRWVARGRDV